VPARRTRDPEEVSIAWQIDAYRFDLPLMASPMDSVVSPANGRRQSPARRAGRPRRRRLVDPYEDPEPLLAEVTSSMSWPPSAGCRPCTPRPSPRTSSAAGSKEIARAGVTTAASLSPQRTARYYKAVVDAWRGHLRHPRYPPVLGRARLGPGRAAEPEAVILRARRPVVVGGCATYAAALPLMRTGAAGCWSASAAGQATPRAPVLGGRVPDGHRHRRRGRGPPRLPGESVAATCTWSRTVDDQAHIAKALAIGGRRR